MVSEYAVCPFNAENVDFSKCIGKVKKLPEPTAIENQTTSTITYMNFANVVGKEKINEFCGVNSDEMSEENQDFYLLYKVWKSFQNSNEQNSLAAEIAENPKGSNLPEIIVNTSIEKPALNLKPIT